MGSKARKFDRCASQRRRLEVLSAGRKRKFLWSLRGFVV
jgi:hypothetical protein